ncbi:MAG: MarR family winged helix-turn-helix transcriptional regulator [Rhodoblastus sp.]
MSQSPYQQTLGFLFNDTARLMRKRFEQRARHVGLTRAQWHALAYLARNEGIQQSALADLLELEPITLGRILDRLEAADLIERRRHAADRRVWLLHLKPKAHALMTDMFAIGEATRNEALAGIDEADRNALTRILVAVKANLGEACANPIEYALPKRSASGE